MILLIPSYARSKVKIAILQNNSSSRFCAQGSDSAPIYHSQIDDDFHRVAFVFERPAPASQYL